MKVHHDAAQVKALTKEDMVLFYNQYLLPSSPIRSKISVHLNAQASAAPSGPVLVIEKGLEAMEQKEQKAADLTTEAEGDVQVSANGTKPYIITDVREFKMRMQVSAGPQPVKDLSEFEELDSKL